ncbi:hypothetical protein J6590_086828 [Homalodisca vitripennis]|nr:hypothetical protein J6590_086828 [Homalodisca vitripennis]
MTSDKMAATLWLIMISLVAAENDTLLYSVNETTSLYSETTAETSPDWPVTVLPPRPTFIMPFVIQPSNDRWGPYFEDGDGTVNVTARVGSNVQFDCRIGMLQGKTQSVQNIWRLSLDRKTRERFINYDRRSDCDCWGPGGICYDLRQLVLSPTPVDPACDTSTFMDLVLTQICPEFARTEIIHTILSGHSFQVVKVPRVTGCTTRSS